MTASRKGPCSIKSPWMIRSPPWRTARKSTKCPLPSSPSTKGSTVLAKSRTPGWAPPSLAPPGARSDFADALADTSRRGAAAAGAAGLRSPDAAIWGTKGLAAAGAGAARLASAESRASSSTRPRPWMAAAGRDSPSSYPALALAWPLGAGRWALNLPKASCESRSRGASATAGARARVCARDSSGSIAGAGADARTGAACSRPCTPLSSPPRSTRRLPISTPSIRAATACRAASSPGPTP